MKTAIQKIMALINAPAESDDLETLFESLSQIRETRISAQHELSGADAKRQELLLSSESVETVLAHDVTTDRLRLQIERLDLAEQQISDRISAAQDRAEEYQWRELFDARHEALVDYAAKLQAAAEALERCKIATDQVNGSGLARSRGFSHENLPVVLGVAEFAADVARSHTTEMQRRGATK